MTVRIGEVGLGPGRPRICVPLTAATVAGLEQEARVVGPEVADLVELRIDRFAGVADLGAVERAIALVRIALDPGLPILLTCRTVHEGGGADLLPDAYAALVGLAARHSGVAAVDVEMERPAVAAAVGAVHEAGKPAVLSFHDLTATPPQEAIVERLVRQQAMGADVVKLACTPSEPADVLTLLAATAQYTARPDARPAVTMAMGPLGVVSRIAGETFGSVLTFGTVGAPSAPGQVDAARLRDALNLVHEAQQR